MLIKQLVTLFILACILNENAVAQQLQVVKNAQLGSVLSQSKEMSGKPQPLTLAEKIKIAQEILKEQGQKVTSLESPITLSLTNMFIKNRAILGFFRPTSVSGFQGGEVKFPANKSLAYGESSLNVEFTAPSAGKYLFNVVIHCSNKDAKFTVTGKGNILTLAGTSNNSSDRNLSFVMDATPGNENIYFQLSGDAVWKFYLCEISQIK